MPEQTKKPQNKVRIVGYLKENNLELITNSRGDSVVRGSLVIATDEVNSHKVQFYVAEKTKAGEPSKDYAELVKLLPESTVTVASYLEADPSADFQTAANAATKIWAMARFDEYAKNKDGKEVSSVTMKGFRAGLKTAADKNPFAPVAEFTVDAYIDTITEEVGDTGRLVLETYLPKYDGSVQKIVFVAPTEDGIASYIKGHYAPHDTVMLTGDIVSIQQRKLVEDTAPGAFFGRALEPQYETTFVRERIIRGGSATPIHQGEEGCIADAAVKSGLVMRKMTIDGNTAKDGMSYSASKGGFHDPAPKAKATAGFAAQSDVDF